MSPLDQSETPTQPAMPAVTPPTTESRLLTVEERIGAAESRIGKLEGRADVLDVKVDEGARKHDALASDVAVIKADMVVVKDETTKQTASLKRIEDAVLTLAKQFGGILADPRVKLVFRAVAIAILFAIAGWLAQHGIKVEIPQ